ncbi:Adhesion G protein-coupled receptor L3 [Amphibalanus amphitrite]|uniref:Adhesion G protein-coupled receptor L3 n=1 Tax=Amphibalanus amphitrite TaxID=1232801 RepID=A0A6A4W8P7_AMPAM|nr:Adhesion G protein-coupled receptor L3 [Amphibalanus amphitrite]
MGVLFGPRRPVLLTLLLVASAASSVLQSHRTFREGDSELRWINTKDAKSRWNTITTEGFGEPPWSRRELPKSTTWFLQAPNSSYAIIVYMTQYHLADGDLRVSSFRNCRNASRTRNIVKCSWGQPVSDISQSFEAPEDTNIFPVRHTTRYVATKAGDEFLVLIMNPSNGDISGPADGCLQSSVSRGFNITYNVVELPAGTDVKTKVKPDRCDALRCNLNGDCHMTSHYERFYCQCQPGFYGDSCQFGPLCDPKNNVNPCQNNGTCRQRRDVAECKCPIPYHGARCHLKLEGVIVEPNYLRRYTIELTVTDTDIELNSSNIETRLGFNHSIYSQAGPLRVAEFDNSLQDASAPRRLLLLFTALGSDETALYRWFSDGVSQARIGAVGVRPLQFAFSSEPELAITSLSLDDHGRPQTVGSRAQLTCYRHSAEPVRRTIQLRLSSLQLALHITPPLATVRPGRNVTITCTLRSSKQNRDQTTISWRKAVGRGPFRLLTSQDHEQVVTYCWGSSVLVIREPETARYECFAHLPPAASNRVTADVLVITPGQTTCPRVKDGNITWQETAVGREDIQPCPGDDEDIQLPGRVIKMDQLMAGYDVTSPESVLADVHEVLKRRVEAALDRQPARLLSSEVESFRSVLVGMSSYVLKVATDEQLKEVEQDFIHTVAPLLGTEGDGQLSDQVSEEMGRERDEFRCDRGRTEHKAELLAANLNFLLRRVFVREPIDTHPDDMFITTRLLPYHGDGMLVVTPFHMHNRPHWMRSAAGISLGPTQPWRSHVVPASELGLVMVVHRHTRALYPHSYIPDDNGEELGRSGERFLLDSHIVSVGLSKQPRLLESPFPPSVQMTLSLEPLSARWNESSQRHSCAQLSSGGRWRLDACQLSRSNHSVNCSCQGLGTFALALVTQEPSPLDYMLLTLHVPVVVGCVLSLLVLLYTSLALLVHWWRRRSVPAGLQLQSSLVLFAAFAVILVCAGDTHKSIAWMAGCGAFLQFLVLSAISTQMGIKMHVFGEQLRLKQMGGDPKYFKFIAYFISTGVPALVTAATITVQVTHGWHLLRSWWMVRDSTLFYGVLVPASILLIIDTVLLLFVRATLTIGLIDPAAEDVTCRLNEWRSLMWRSHILEAVVVLVMIPVSALYINFPGPACEVLFGLFCLLTSVTLLMCYVIYGDTGVPTRPCGKKPSKNKDDDGGHRKAPATLRSRAVLSFFEPSQKPLLPRNGSRLTSAGVLNDNPGTGTGSGCGSGSGGSGGSAETEECAISSAPDSSSFSSSDSGASQLHAPTGRPVASNGSPVASSGVQKMQVRAEISSVNCEAFDPPPKPGRQAVTPTWSGVKRAGPRPAQKS